MPSDCSAQDTIYIHSSCSAHTQSAGYRKVHTHTVPALIHKNLCTVRVLNMVQCTARTHPTQDNSNTYPNIAAVWAGLHFIAVAGTHEATKSADMTLRKVRHRAARADTRAVVKAARGARE